MRPGIPPQRIKPLPPLETSLDNDEDLEDILVVVDVDQDAKVTTLESINQRHESVAPITMIWEYSSDTKSISDRVGQKFRIKMERVWD